MTAKDLKDWVPMATLIGTIVIGAVVTTSAVKANTSAIEELTDTVKGQDSRVTDLEKWRIEMEAFQRGMEAGKLISEAEAERK